MESTRQSRMNLGVWAGVGAILIPGFASDVRAQPQGFHGVQIGKSCRSPRCVGETTDCLIEAGYDDDFNDTVELQSSFDVVDPLGPDCATDADAFAGCRVPPMGNLPIVAVSGNTTCTVGGALPCLICAGGFPCGGPVPISDDRGVVVFQSNTYVIQPGDPTLLEDQATVRIRDLCDGCGAPPCAGCSGLPNSVQFTAATQVLRCDDENACSTDCCIPWNESDPNPANWVPAHCTNTSVCEDTSCDAGSTPLSCDDGLLCTINRCDDTNPDTCCASDPLCPPGVACCADGTVCDDGNACTIDSCVDGCCTSSPACVSPDVCCADGTPCDDGNACTDDACGPNGCCGPSPHCPPGVVCCADGTVCDDGDPCTLDSCVEGCCTTSPPCVPPGVCCADGTVCDDGNACTDDACGPDGCCGPSPHCPPGVVCCADGTVCDDGDACTVDSCVDGCCTSSQLCVGPDVCCADGTACDDGNPCTDDACGPDGCCGSTPHCPPGVVCCADGTSCSDGDPCTADTCVAGCCVTEGACECGDGIVGNTPGETCDPPGSAVGSPGETCRNDCTYCGDGNVDSGEACDDGNEVDEDSCQNDCTLPEGGAELCRTPGFWATHACGSHGGFTNCEKNNSRNITQTVIDDCGGCLDVCGDVVTNTIVLNADSALEAMCVAPRGTQVLQLVRQLTAAALNCCISASDASCGGVSVEPVFSACNAACAMGQVTANVGGHTVDCINAIDCFNNGGQFDRSDGACWHGFAEDCHQRAEANFGICADGTICTDGTCADGSQCKPGPAGSSRACNSATANKCQVVNLATNCTAGGTNGPQSCP